LNKRFQFIFNFIWWTLSRRQWSIRFIKLILLYLLLVDKIHHFQIGYIISCDVFISFLFEVQFILYQKPITSIVFIYQLIHFHNVSLKCYKHIVALYVIQIFLFYLFEIFIRNLFNHLFESSIFIIMEIIYYLVHEIHINFVYDFNDNYSPIIFVDF
jgi:hypothetical protein